MKHLKIFEELFDKTITDGKFTIGDMVHIDGWDDAKLLKVYDDKCLVEFIEDGYQTTIKKDELTKFTSEEIELYKNTKKYNL